MKNHCFLQVFNFDNRTLLKPLRRNVFSAASQRSCQLETSCGATGFEISLFSRSLAPWFL